MYGWGVAVRKEVFIIVAFNDYFPFLHLHCQVNKVNSRESLVSKNHLGIEEVDNYLRGQLFHHQTTTTPSPTVPIMTSVAPPTGVYTNTHLQKVYWGPGCTSRALPEAVNLLSKTKKALILTGNSLANKTNVIKE